MLTGSLVAIVTPMKKGGALDLPALGKLIDFHVANGTAGIVVVGTTGESPTVDVEEHCLLIKTAVDEARGRIPIVAGTGANSTAEAIALTAYAKEAGAASALSVVPVLQQADAGRALSPFPHDRRKGRPSAAALQRARAHRRRPEQRDDPASRRDSRHRRHQGRHRRSRPRQRAPQGSRRGLAARLRRLQRRRHHGAAAPADGRPRRDLRHGQRRAEADGRDVQGGARRRRRHGAQPQRSPARAPPQAVRRGESDPREVGARRRWASSRTSCGCRWCRSPPDITRRSAPRSSEAGCL